MFFRFNQNNSGGYFVNDNVACHNVIIEADNYKIANDKAEDLGLFSYDWCECCGERFSFAWRDSEGDDIPRVYGEPVELYVDDWTKAGHVYARVFYKDGTKLEYTKK